jgi:hypothetical protein
MKPLLLCLLAMVAPSIGRSAAADARIYVHLLRGQDEFLFGTAQRHGQESATIVHPRHGEPVIVVILPWRRDEDALIGIRFFAELSEVQSPAEGLQYITARWDTPTKFSSAGVDYILIASLKGWPPQRKKPNQAPEPTPGSVTPRATAPTS